MRYSSHSEFLVNRDLDNRVLDHDSFNLKIKVSVWSNESHLCI